MDWIIINILFGAIGLLVIFAGPAIANGISGIEGGSSLTER